MRRYPKMRSSKSHASSMRRSGAAGGTVAVCLLVAGTAASCGARSPLADLDAFRDGAAADARIGDALPPFDSGEAGVSCTPGSITMFPATPVVDFVLDASGSMNEPLVATNPTSKWNVLTSSLELALPPIDATTEIGALIFPSNHDPSSCEIVPTPTLVPATNNVATLISDMRAVTPLGGTPSALSIQYAAQELLSLRTASSARAIVLATDGSPNCNAELDGNNCTCTQADPQACALDSQNCLDDARAEKSISDALTQGIPTYVIGIENSDDAQFESVLNAMAVAGGRPAAGATKYYPARSSSELTAAFTAISQQVASCTYLTTSVPGDTGTIVVTLDGVVIPFDPTGKSGWSWADKTNGEIQLSGAACKQAASESAPSLVANVTCGDGGLPDAAIFDAEVGGG